VDFLSSDLTNCNLCGIVFLLDSASSGTDRRKQWLTAKH